MSTETITPPALSVKFNRGELLGAIKLAAGVTLRKTNNAALQGVKFTVTRAGVFVEATDLERRIRVDLEQVQTESQGEAIVNAEKLLSCIKGVSDDAVAVALEGDYLVLRGDRSKFKLPTQSVETFPPPLASDYGKGIDLEAPSLRRMLTSVRFAADESALKFSMSTVLFVCERRKFEVVATDGRRLAMASTELSADAKLSMLVPVKSVGVIIDVLDGMDSVEIAPSGNTVRVTAGRVTLWSVLAEGTFAPYQDIIPKDADRKLNLPIADLLDLTRQAAMFTSEESKGVRFQFDSERLALSSRSPTTGEADVHMAAKLNGPSIVIGLNPAFLVEALRVMDVDEVLVEMSAPSRPVVFKAGASFTYLQMPVNLA